jgi:hypothetical protein
MILDAPWVFDARGIALPVNLFSVEPSSPIPGDGKARLHVSR